MLVGVVRNTQLKFRRNFLHYSSKPVVFSIDRKSIKNMVLFRFSETHPNVSWGSKEYSAKVSAKALALY